jgi:hypothetical protein
MTSMLGAVRMCTSILWDGMASEKTPRGVIPPICMKYRRTIQEKKCILMPSMFFVSQNEWKPVSADRQSKEKQKIELFLSRFILPYSP